jgi:phage gp29-like protein
LEFAKEHSMGTDNAQLAIMRLADEACYLVMLGQTLTSTTPTNGGTRAQGDVHENVEQKRFEEYIKWIARILTEQFAESLLVENYGNSYLRNPERPTVEADMTRPLSASEQSEYLQKVSNSKVPAISTEIYKRAGLTEPEPGDRVLVGGEIVILEEAVTPSEKRQQLFDEQLDQQLTIASLQQPDGQLNDGPKPPKQLNDAPDADTIEAALKVADPDEVSELENLVQAAEHSPRNNGEVQAVQVKIRQLVSNRR